MPSGQHTPRQGRQRTKAKRFQGGGDLAPPKCRVKGQVFGHCQRRLQRILAGDVAEPERMAGSIGAGGRAFQQHLTTCRRQQPGNHAEQA